jgi:biofilm protein TabA
MIQTYTSRAVTDNPRFEAHRKYLDIQYVVSGTEAMGWAPLEQLEVNVPYMDDRDILLGTVSAGARTFVPFGAGYAILLFPSDAHGPGLAAGEPEPIVKVVVKVLLNE